MGWLLDDGNMFLSSVLPLRHGITWAQANRFNKPSVPFGATTQELIEAGYLSKIPRVPPVFQVTGVGCWQATITDDGLSRAMNKSALSVANVATTWIERRQRSASVWPGCRRPAFAETRRSQRFLEAGVSAEYIDAYTERVDRDAIRKRFHAVASRLQRRLRHDRN